MAAMPPSNRHRDQKQAKRHMTRRKSRLTRKPRNAGMWKSSANPVRPYADWLKESKEYIQFVNPGDLRVAEETCGIVGLPRARSARGPDQHDDAWGHVMAGSALQQRRVRLQRRPLRGKLFAGRAAATH